MTKKYTNTVRCGWLLVACAAIFISACSVVAGSTVNSNKPAQAALPPVSLHLPPLGLRLRDMSPVERSDLKLNHGVIVVVAVGASAMAGVREDDIILCVDKKPVTNTEQFWLLVDATKWNCTLQIMRKDQRLEVVIGAKEGY